MSDVVQDYLKAIYKLQTTAGKVSTSALAERMGVTAPSATNMIQRLSDLGLLRHDRYHGAELTETGARTALEVIRHHRLWELFLAEALRVPLDRVHGEAERLEHTLSDDLEERIDLVLGHPTFDPHGDPIPSKDGNLDHTIYPTLNDLIPGRWAVVQRVPDSEPELLHYLGDIRLVPGARVSVTKREPFGGPLFIDVVDNPSREPAGEPRAIGPDLARHIFVAVSAESEFTGMVEGPS